MACTNHDANVVTWMNKVAVDPLTSMLLHGCPPLTPTDFHYFSAELFDGMQLHRRCTVRRNDSDSHTQCLCSSADSQRHIAWTYTSVQQSGQSIPTKASSGRIKADQCAPVEGVTRPRLSSAGDSCAMKFVAARNLNEPVGCKFSSFK
jgi:hypothetical protein